MTDYQIEPNTRRCAVTGRLLLPGERYFSVLVEVAGKFVRRDYAAESWTGPPAEALGFWSGRIRADNKDRPAALDDDLLLECFQRLEAAEEPGQVNFRYVVALLLLRRKRLRLEATQREGDSELLLLRCPRSRQLYRVVNPCLTEEQLDTVQEEVFRVLGWQ